MKKQIFRYFFIPLFLFSLLFDSQPVQARSSHDSEDYFLSMTKASLLTEESMTLFVEGISEEEVSFKSEDSSIVSIQSTNGNSCEFTGKAVGNTVITVKIRKKGILFFMNSTTTLRCKVSVTPSAVSIRFKKKTYRLMVGEKKKINVILRPSITSEKPLFSSSNRKVATVNTNGRIRAKSIGNATITATLKNGTAAQCKVIVSDP